MKKKEREPKTYSTKYRDNKACCMNCSGYDLEYGYCKNKDSDFYQLEMGCGEVCSEWER